MNKKIILKIIIMVITLIAVLGIGIFAGIKIGKTFTAKEEVKEMDNRLKAINFYENFSKMESVKNLDGVVWNNVRITQIDDKMEVNILLNNQLKDQKVGEADLRVKLYDKDGKAIYSKDARMSALEANFGSTTVNLEFDIKDISIIYDVEVEAILGED